MSHFVTGVLEDLQEECHSVMLHENMNISRLMVNARRVEESRFKRTSRDAKRAISFDCGAINNMLEIQYKPRFKKTFSNHVPSIFPKARDDKVSKPIAPKGRSGKSPNEKTTCAKCGKGHHGECLVGRRNGFGCGKNGHKVTDCRNLKGQEKGAQAQASGSSDAPKKNRFYALHSMCEQDTSPDVVTDMLKVITIDVYALIYRVLPRHLLPLL